jgi:predicted ATPase
MLTTLSLSGYRSLRNISLELDALNIVTGPNGSGKSSLYRALRLLAEIAQGGVVRLLALEGGVDSALWAGPGKGPISIRLGYATDDYGYAIDLGLPIPIDGSMFNFDPVIKTESMWVGQVLRPRNELARRGGPMAKVRDSSHNWQVVLTDLAPFDSMMTHAGDPQKTRELLMLREFMRNWRFYDHFRTDRDAPVRQPQIGTRTPVLSSDGHDLAAAIRTIFEIGFVEDFNAALEDAFPGADVSISTNGAHFELSMTQAGLHRPLQTAELSDGTLRYLLLIAALLSPRPPPLMVLNEPEMSLPPSLLPPLGRLIAKASQRAQTIVVSHAPELVAAIENAAPARKIALYKHNGETRIEGNEPPSWEWPDR